MPKIKPNNSWYSFTTIAIIILCALMAVYFFSYVPSNKKYLTNRNLRILAVMGNQVKFKVESFSGILKHIMDESKGDENFIEQKIKLVPNLDFVKNNGKSDAKKADANDSLDIYISLDGNDYWLNYEYSHQSSPKKIHTKTNLAKLINPIVSKEDFDNILLLKLEPKESQKGKGKVIYQRNRSGFAVNEIDSVYNKNGTGEILGSVASNSFVKQITLTGADYTVFGYPVWISFNNVNTETDKPPEKWLLCGLVRTENFTAQSRKISNSYIILFMFLAITAFLSIPIIKVQSMGPQDKLGRIDVILLLLSLFVLTVLTTAFLLDGYAIHNHNKHIDGQLKKMALEIKSNFNKELTTGIKKLDALNVLFSSDTLGLNKSKILSNREIIFKPYFEMVYWIDSTGEQQAKWSVRDQTTPLINVSKRPYYYKLVADEGFSMPRNLNVNSLKDKSYMLDPIDSWTTGEYETILTIPFDNVRYKSFDKDTLLTTLDSINKPIVVSALDMHMVSLNAPILPPGYGFAVIDNNGNVLYHSDSRRNLQENFFEECNDSHHLYSVVYGREEKTLKAKYSGTDHRLLITPLESPPWTLIVFRDKELFGAVNAEMLTIIVGLIIAYMVFLFIVLAITKFISKRKFFLKLAAIWPNEKKSETYLQLTIIMAALSLLFIGSLLFIQNIIVVAILAFVPGPFLLLYFCYLQKEKREFWKTKDHSAENNKAKILTRNYVLMWFMLFVLLGVVPVAGFFKFAYKIETELFIKHGQFELAQALGEREKQLTTEYRKIKGEPAKQALQNRLSFSDKLDIYTSFFYQTHFPNTIHNELDGKSYNQHLLEEMFINNMLFHNDVTKNLLGHIYDFTGDNRWKWYHKDHKLILETFGNKKYNQFKIETTLPKITLISGRSIFPGILSLLLFALVAVVICIIFFQLIRTISKTVFLLDFPELERNDFSSLLEEAKFNKLMLIHVSDKKNKEIKNSEDVHYIDLLNAENWNDPDLISTLPHEKIIVIDNFDSRLANFWNKHQLLGMMEALVSRLKNKLIILSSLDPTPLTYPQNEKNKEENNSDALRWKTVMNHFKKVLFIEKGDTTECKNKMKQHFSSINDLKQRELIEDLKNECSQTFQLQKITEEIVAHHEKLHGKCELNTEQFIEETRKYAQSHYQDIWRTCSVEEKHILMDLAKDGFVNSQNHEAIINLFGGGLIRREPQLLLMNESFRSFILSQPRPELVSQTKSSWGKLKIPLLIVIVVLILFLLYTQPNLFKSTIAIVSAITAGIPALIKLLGAAKLGKSADGA